MGSKLLASANAPAFTGNITIVLTDGVTTVNKVIAIDRRATTASALFTQIVEFVSGTGFNDSFIPIELLTKRVTSETGFETSFSFFSISTILSTVGPKDTIERDDQVVANDVVFDVEFYTSAYVKTADYALAFEFSVFRRFADNPETTNAKIGCVVSSAASFRAALLAAMRLKFNRPAITFQGCGTGSFFTGGPEMIEYTYLKN